MMKKIVLILSLVFTGFSTNAQINIGLSAGLPMGDFSDAYSLGINLDASYLSEVSEGLLVGGTTGVIYTLGDSVGSFEFEDLGFIPVAIAGRYVLSEKISTGADVGYALAFMPSGADGGFYYAPRAQYNFSENVSGVLAYRSVSNNGSLNFLTLGVEFKF